jgi:hypothetical protein
MTAILTPLLEPLARLLQLYELASAVGSPIGAASENQQESFGASQLGKGSLLAILIGEPEAGYLLADL